MELFTFALVIWVIYLGLALWPESEKSHRGENGVVTGKGHSDDPVEYERRQAFKYVKKAAAERVLDLYGQLFPPMSKAA